MKRWHYDTDFVGQAVVMVTLDCLMDLMVKVVEWRSVWVASGVQCVMMAGTAMMLLQCVDNWDTTTLVLKC